MRGCYSQYNASSISASTAPSFTFGARIVQSHGGYSSSGNATGSLPFFRKFSPLSGVPAGTEDSTIGDGGVAFLPRATPAFLGDGVSGVLKGWAAPVDVAAGGWCESEVPLRGAEVTLSEVMVFALRWEVLVKGRDCLMAFEAERGARRIQRWHIMLLGMDLRIRRVS